VAGEFARTDENRVPFGAVDHSARGSHQSRCTEEAKPETAQESTQLDLRLPQLADDVEMLFRQLAGRVEVFDRRVLPQNVVAGVEKHVAGIDDLAHRVRVRSQVGIIGRQEHIATLIDSFGTNESASFVHLFVSPLSVSTH
jgi:hypothetical protein